MSNEMRTERIARDTAALEGLHRASSIFAFESSGDPAERFLLVFHGRGLHRKPGATEPEILGEHRVELRLLYQYPAVPPDVQWRTPLFHPNVSFSGFVNWSDLGLVWTPDMGLDVVCERLWDFIRLAQCNRENAVSHASRDWLAKQTTYSLPLDARPLRDRAAGVNRNVVRYRRRGETAATGSDEEIIFLDQQPRPVPLPPAEGRERDRSAAAGDILYIDE